MCYLDIVLQLLPPLLRRFGPQVGVPFAGEVWSLNDLPELQGEMKHAMRSTHIDCPDYKSLDPK